MGVVALLVRLLHLVDLMRLPLFEKPTVDAALYVEAAQRIAATGIPHEVFFKPPLYPLLLAAVWGLVGENYFLLRLPLVLLGAGTAFLTWLLARRLFGARVALLAGIFYALHRSSVHVDAELLEMGLVSFLQIGALFLTLRAGDQGASKRLRLLAGFTLGLGCVARPTFLVFAALALWWLGRRAMRLALLGTVLAIAPVTLHNASHGRDFVLVSSNLGLNFYIGNNPTANGRISSAPDLPAQPAAAQRRAHEIATAAAGHALHPSEVSRYWLLRGLEHVLHAPGQTLALTLRKLFFAWHGSEISDNEDLAGLRHWLRVYAWLPIGMWLLAPLGLVGLLLARGRQRDLRLVRLYVVAQIAALLPFFVVERFRQPWSAVLAIFTAWTLLRIAESIRQRTPTRRLLAASLVALLLLNAPVLGVRDPVLFDFDYKIGYAYQQKGELDEAERAYREAIRRNPTGALARNALGYLLAEQGESLDEAVGLIEEALRLDPSHTANYAESLAFAHLQRGDAPKALEACSLGLRSAQAPNIRAALWSRQAQAHRLLGDVPAERESLRRLLEVEGDGARARAARQRLAELGSSGPGPR